MLISGDRDFAADIADYKRRMRLSVILLHTNNCPQSLMLAASEHYNFQELLSSVPVEARLPWENSVRPTLDEGRTTQVNSKNLKIWILYNYFTNCRLLTQWRCPICRTCPSTSPSRTCTKS